MPSYEEHVKFILSNPYKIWYIIYLGNTKSGSIYLSKQNEIGLFILSKHQGKNIGKQALQLLMKKTQNLVTWLTLIQRTVNPSIFSRKTSSH